MLRRRLTASLHPLPEYSDSSDNKRGVYHTTNDEQFGRIFAKRRKPYSQQSTQDNYGAKPSAAGPLSHSNNRQKRNNNGARRIEGRQWRTSLFAKRNADDSNEASSIGRNTTSTNNRKCFASKEKVNRSRMIEEPSLQTIDSASNTTNSTFSDRKSGDRKPISSVARALAGFFGDLNATQTTATVSNSSTNVSQDSKFAPRSVENITTPQPSDNGLSVFSAVIDHVILDTAFTVTSNSSLPENKSTTLMDGSDNTNTTLSVEANSTNVDSSISTPIDAATANSPVKKKPKLKVVWLDTNVKSDDKKKASMVSVVRESTLTCTLELIDSTTINISGSNDDAILEAASIDILPEAVTSSPAADTNQTAALSSTSLEIIASEVNVSISNTETTIKEITEANLSENTTLDNGDFNRTTNGSLPDSFEASTMTGAVDADAVSPVSFGSVSPTLPLMADVNFAPSSVTFEPGPPPAPLLPNDSALPGSPKFEPGSPPAPLLPKDTVSPSSSYKSDEPSDSQECDVFPFGGNLFLTLLNRCTSQLNTPLSSLSLPLE